MSDTALSLLYVGCTVLGSALVMVYQEVSFRREMRRLDRERQRAGS